MEDHTLIDGEVRRRKRNNTHLRKEEEDRQLIADGEGPRKAKTTALKNAAWYEAQGKKRPCSPSPDNHNKGERKRPDEDKQPRKRLQKDRGDAGESQRGQAGGSEETSEDKQPHKRLQTERGNAGESKRGRAGGSEETRAKSQKAVTASTSNTDIHSKELPTKAKPTPKNKQTNRTEVEDSDDSLSSLSDSQGRSDKLDDSDDEEDDDDEDDNDFDIARMTEREVRQLFNDELPQAAAHDAASLFDDDNDIEIATKSRRGSSSEASRPPTSESEGMFDEAGDSGEEEIDDHDTFP